MLTATVPFQWTGHVLMTSRNQVAEALKRDETKRTGVYILLGDRLGFPIAYIGEAEEIRQRIREHAKKKDWWTSAIMITSTGNDLNKAHVKYLESRMVETALSLGNIPLENGNTPPRPSLTEAAQSNMEGFLETLLLVLPALRVDMFLSKKREPTITGYAPIVEVSNRPRFELILKKESLKATAELFEGDFTVLEGSDARSEWVGKEKAKPSYQKLHEKLVQQGILEPHEGQRTFVKSYAFDSPSAAAAVVTGRSTNGRHEWKHIASGKTFGAFEEERLKETLPEFTLDDLNIQEEVT